MGYINAQGQPLADFWEDLYKAGDAVTGGAVSQIGQGAIDKAADFVGIEGDTRKIVDSGLNIGKDLLGVDGNSGGGQTTTQTTVPASTNTSAPIIDIPQNTSTSTATTTSSPSTSSPTTNSTTSNITASVGGFFGRIPPVALGFAGGGITYLISKSPLISAITGVAVSIVGIQLQRRSM